MTAGSFAVTVDLAAYDMSQAPELQSLRILVRPVTSGITVMSYVPSTVSVALDRLEETQVRVAVDNGEVPEGLEISTPQMSVRQVTASGPESLLHRVDRALATVRIDESGIDCCGQVDLVPVDIDGRRVESVELNPSTVRVQIDVSTVETSRTVPIRPLLTGAPAAGFEVGTVSAEPSVVTLRGAPEVLAAIAEVLTEPISLSGSRFDAACHGEPGDPRRRAARRPRGRRAGRRGRDPRDDRDSNPRARPGLLRRAAGKRLPAPHRASGGHGAGHGHRPSTRSIRLT